MPLRRAPARRQAVYKYAGDRKTKGSPRSGMKHTTRALGGIRAPFLRAWRERQSGKARGLPQVFENRAEETGAKGTTLPFARLQQERIGARTPKRKSGARKRLRKSAKGAGDKGKRRG